MIREKPIKQNHPKSSPNPNRVSKCTCTSMQTLMSRYVWSSGQYIKGRHCCSVGELKITFASTCNHGCKESVFNVLFNVLFLVLYFPLGAPNTLLKHVIERSIWRIVVGEGSWWGWGFSLGDWVFDLVGVFPWLRSFGLTFRLLVLREYSYLGVYLSAVTLWFMPFVLVSCC